MQRNLINVQNKVDNYPVLNQAQNNYVLVYQNGVLLWEPQSGGGSGITTVNSVGIGNSIINSVTPTTLNLKSIFAGSGIQILATSTTLTIALDISITNQYLYSDGTNIIGKNAIEACQSLDPTFPIYNNTSLNNAFFKGLQNGTGISITNNPNVLTIGNSGVLSVNSISVSGGIPLIGTGGQNVLLNQLRPGANITITGPTSGAITIANNGVRTVSNASSTINSLISSSSTANNILLKTLSAGSNITITDSGPTLTISSTGGGAGTTIYNSNGTLNSLQRIVSGNSPGNIANNILWDDIIPAYNSTWMTPINVPIENSGYSGIQDPTLMMCSTFNGSQGKFLYAPYNYLSQKIEFKLDGGFGDTKIIYAVYCAQTKSYIIEVDLYEIEDTIRAFAATWKFTLNASNIGTGWFQVEPECSSRIVSNPPENFIALLVEQTIGVGTAGLQFAFQQQGIGTGAQTSKYVAFFKCLHQGDGSCGIYDNALGPLSTTQPRLFQKYLYQAQGFGVPPLVDINYTQFGRDLKVTLFGNVQQITSSGVAQDLQMFWNGNNIVQFKAYTNSVSNVNSFIGGSRILLYTDLITSGSLVLGGPTQLFWQLQGTNYSFLNYEILIEYC